MRDLDVLKKMFVLVFFLPFFVSYIFVAMNVDCVLSVLLPGLDVFICS